MVEINDHEKTIRAPLMALPTHDDLQPPIAEDLARLGRAFVSSAGRHRPGELDRVMRAQEFRFRQLAHPLSQASRNRRVQSVLSRDRTLRERAAFEHLCAATVGTTMERGLLWIIREVAERLGAGTLRRGDICSAPDREGYRVRFPSADHIEERLVELGDYVQMHHARRPELTGMVTLCAIGNLHPLEDGNGRLGRVLFNYLMPRPCNIGRYLPLYEISHATLDGALIAMREAQFLGRWENIARILSRSAEIFFDFEAGNEQTAR